MDNENIIYVDADTRKAVLHSSFKVGVVNDDSCCTLTFRINKASDIDLTDLTFYVNTMSASGSGDRLDCTKEEDDQYIFIKCLLKGTIFEAKGKATINLCGREYDSNNSIIKKWGSEDITVLVGSHTDSDKAIEERYPSVLEDLKNKINNLNITDAQINTIATKVAAKGFYTKSEVDGLIAKIAVPTKLSQLADDTAHRLVTDAEKARWNNKFSGNYNDLTNKPTIPTKLSQLAEDDSHMTVSKAQKTKIDTVPTQFKTINNQSITGAGNITIPTSGTGTSITVDSALSSTSTNPVQNKVVTSALKNKANTDDLGIKKYEKSDASITLESGSYVVFPEMESITVTLGAVANNIMYIAGFEFSSGATATSLVLTGCTVTSDSDSVDVNSKYEVNILGTSAIIRKR